ncbi:MAG: pilus assembly protein PilP [Nitrospirota bacterium]
MSNKLAYLLILIFLASLAGCKDKSIATKKSIARKSVTASAAPQAEVRQEEPKVEKEIFNYDPNGRRDPFESLVEPEKIKQQRKKGATPIENFDVDEIRLIAIAWDSQQYYALITLPDNKSYTIKKGMTLGLYGGRVEEITRDSVLIRELVKDYRGQTKLKDTILKLRKEGEE